MPQRVQQSEPIALQNDCSILVALTVVSAPWAVYRIAPACGGRKETVRARASPCQHLASVASARQPCERPLLLPLANPCALTRLQGRHEYDGHLAMHVPGAADTVYGEAEAHLGGRRESEAHVMPWAMYGAPQVQQSHSVDAH
jgi:hypothetical protein